MVSIRLLAELTRATYAQRGSESQWEQRATFGLEQSAFHAVLWSQSNSSQSVLVIRGTVNILSAMQDLRLLCGREPRAWKLGLRAIDDVRKIIGADSELLLTGHSLGGAFASALANTCDIPAIVFNAPGMRSVLPDELVKDNERLLEICIAKDWIRRLSGTGLGRKIILGTKAEIPKVRPGPLGLVRALRNCRLPNETSAEFVRRSLLDHSMSAFKPWMKYLEVDHRVAEPCLS